MKNWRDSREVSSKRDANGHWHPFYSAWVNLRQRCDNPKKPDYYRYGGRGISYCKRWSDFNNFYDDMYESFVNHRTGNINTTIERIDVDADYSPSNCTWATREEQSNNRAFNKKITFGGKTQTLGRWASDLNIGATYHCLYKRIFTRQWSIERAFRTPVSV